MDPVTRRAMWVCGLCMTVIAVLAGCGSKSHGTSLRPAANNGSAVISFEWPELVGAGSREIPSDTATIVIRVFTDKELTDLNKGIPRPTDSTTSTVRLNGLPNGPVLFVVEAHDANGKLLASGSKTVNIPSDGTPAAVAIDLVPITSASVTSTGFITVTVTDIPAPTASSGPMTVEVQAWQNGVKLPDTDSANAFETFTVDSTLPVSAVPLRLGALPVGSLLFTATAQTGTGADKVTAASGSTIGQVSATSDAAVSVKLAVGSSGSTGGTNTTSEQPTTGAVVVTASNISRGTTSVTVTPVSGDPAVSHPTVTVPLPTGAAASSGLRVPVLVAQLQPGPWLFLVTTGGGTENRIGSVNTTVKVGDMLDLAVPLGSSSDPTPTSDDGDLNVLVTNITGQGISTLLIVALNSTGQAAGTPLILPQTNGINQRLVKFTVPGGPYTVVAAAYTTVLNPSTPITNTIPPGAQAIGAATTTVVSHQSVDAQVDLRVQGNTDAAGSANLAMLNVPLRIEYKQVGGVTIPVIASGIVVKTFSVADNQEITALQRNIVTSQYLSLQYFGEEGTIAVGGVAGPVRIRLDGVPVGPMLFQVESTYNADGSGPLLGNGSAIADIKPPSDASLGDGINPVTVTVLPHGDIADVPGGVLPGISSSDPDGQNPAPRSRAVLEEAARRFRAALRRQ